MNAPSTELCERLTGSTPTSVKALANYDYRSGWRVETAGGVFVVKCDTRPGAQAIERDALEHARALGIAVPPVAGFEAGLPAAMAIAWVAGVAIHRAPTERALASAGEALGTLHRSSAMAGIPSSPARSGGLEAAIAPHLDYLLVRNRVTATDADVLLRFARAHAGGTVPGAMLHGDCQAAHFLVDPATERLTAIIDWSDVRLGDPAEDFGVLCVGHQEFLEPLLAGYGGDAEERERIRRMQPFYTAVRGAAAAEWLDTHGYPGFTWPEETVRAMAEMVSL